MTAEHLKLIEALRDVANRASDALGAIHSATGEELRRVLVRALGGIELRAGTARRGLS